MSSLSNQTRQHFPFKSYRRRWCISNYLSSVSRIFKFPAIPILVHVLQVYISRRVVVIQRDDGGRTAWDLFRISGNVLQSFHYFKTFVRRSLRRGVISCTSFVQLSCRRINVKNQRRPMKKSTNNKRSLRIEINLSALHVVVLSRIRWQFQLTFPRLPRKFTCRLCSIYRLSLDR